MELNNNLIGVQGVLAKCVKQTGEFTKINYRGGNEKSILCIATELQNFLTNKEFMTDFKANEKYKQELNEIVFFLALNTVFKKPLVLDEYFHLTNIIPQLSKCLLVNICFGLNLIHQYGFVIEKLPLEVTEELLDQMMDCLRRVKPRDHIDNVTVLLKAVANKLCSVEVSNKTEDTVEDIVRVCDIILKNILCVSAEDAKNMTQKKIYLSMGFKLLKLFELLLYISPNEASMKSFLACLLHTTSSMIKCITLNVFCCWAEVQYEDQPLQTVVAGQAYLVMEKYNKNKLAAELVMMLGSIARKPKTISQLILEADVATMIKKVNEQNEHQKLWFRALMNTQIYENAEVVESLERWWQLCDESVIDRLLTFPLPSDVKQRQLIVKCASNLPLEGLRRILTSYFFREKFVWDEDTQEKLVLFFNQIHPELSEDELKEALLLLLQNAQLFFRYFFMTAFKNSSSLVQIFNLINNIGAVENISLSTLMQVLDENPPKVQAIGNYIQLFDTMLTCQYCSWDSIVSEVLLKLLEKYRKREESLEEFCCSMQILTRFGTFRCEVERELELLQYVMTCASEYRCTFLNFTSLKEEITKCCVEYMMKKREALKAIIGIPECFSVLGQNGDDPWTNYYRDLFVRGGVTNFIDYVLPDFNLALYQQEKSDENLTRMMKILPLCVSVEWQILLKEIENKCGFTVTVNALTDIVILLCEFTEDQKKKQGDGVNIMMEALKFTLQNFGRFLLEAKSRPDQILAIKDACRVLKYMPDTLRPTEGMSLISVLPDETLKALAHDKEFVGRIVMINDKQICKVLAQKVLGIS